MSPAASGKQKKIYKLKTFVLHNFTRDYHFRHRNGNTSVSIRETPSYIENSADATKLKNRDSTFDISDSISTSLSTVDDNKPFVSTYPYYYVRFGTFW